MDITLKNIEESILAQLRRDWATWPEDKCKTVAIVGLGEEVGEVAGLYKRELRDFPKDRDRCTKERYTEELGDVLWYLIATCIMWDISLETLWKYNIEKLEKRYGKV